MTGRPPPPRDCAVFLDRDGVLNEDVHLLRHSCDLRLLPGVPGALRRLSSAGFRLIVVSNQTVVARGLASEEEVRALHRALERRLRQAGGPPLDAFYFCPHHPNADEPSYRIVCECRKPRQGLLVRAAEEHHLDLGASYMVGDRITDVIAGARAGCRTIQVETGGHLAPPIETGLPLNQDVRPDHVCAGLPEAARWILSRRTA